MGGERGSPMAAFWEAEDTHRQFAMAARSRLAPRVAVGFRRSAFAMARDLRGAHALTHGAVGPSKRVAEARPQRTLGHVWTEKSKAMSFMGRKPNGTACSFG
jgi:hypothetical protein